MKPILILGKSGMLSTSFQKMACNLNVPYTVVSSAELADIINNKNLASLISDFRKSFIFYCLGPTSPSASIADLNHFHLEIPGLIQSLLESMGEVRSFVTFGSIHELVEDMCPENNYLRVKRDWLNRRNSNSLHFQLHTLVGPPLRAESFFFQLAESVVHNKKFLMSQGNQIREFHDVDSVTAVLLRNLCVNEILPPENPMQLSNGYVLSLYEAAANVMKEFETRELICRGALPGPKFEVYEPFWNEVPSPWRPSKLDLPKFIHKLMQQKQIVSREIKV